MHSEGTNSSNSSATASIIGVTQSRYRRQPGGSIEIQNCGSSRTLAAFKGMIVVHPRFVHDMFFHLAPPVWCVRFCRSEPPAKLLSAHAPLYASAESSQATPSQLQPSAKMSTLSFETCPSSAAFFGFMGVASSMVFGSEFPIKADFT